MTDAPQYLTIRKNKDEELRIAIREYKGIQYLNIHLWYQNRSGEMAPGKSDTSIGCGNGKARELWKMIGQVLDEAGY